MAAAEEAALRFRVGQVVEVRLGVDEPTHITEDNSGAWAQGIVRETRYFSGVF